MHGFLCSGLTLLMLTLPAAASAAVQTQTLKHWHDARWQLNCSYPDLFWGYSLPDAGDGVILHSANGETELRIWGGYNIPSLDATQHLQRIKKEVAHIVPASEKSGEGWYSITVSDDGGMNGLEHHTLRYGKVSDDRIMAFSFRYLASDNAVTGALLDSMKQSLSTGSGEADKLPARVMDDFNPRYVLSDDMQHFLLPQADGSFLTAGEALPVEGIVEGWHWFAVGADSPQARPDEYGLWFVNEFDRTTAFLPIEFADMAGSVRISPSGSHLLIDFGTSPVRDIFIYDFRTMRKVASFVGMEVIAWTDARHFLFTHVDMNHALQDGRWDWLSVAEGDIDGKIRFIKAGTDFANYFLNAVDLNRHELEVQEMGVTGEADWKDENRRINRCFNLPLPR